MKGLSKGHYGVLLYYCLVSGAVQLIVYMAYVGLQTSGSSMSVV